MRYYLDFEFIEDFHKPWFGKRRHFIDMISIGIVSEDDRSYYAISTEFSERDANDWVKENVIKNLDVPFCAGRLPDGELVFNASARMDARKSNKRIADDIYLFVHEPIVKKYDDRISFADEIVEHAYKNGAEKHEFYGYFSDYDWVLFCSLFGKMINLPKGFPMYCIDLKQMMDDKARYLMNKIFAARKNGPWEATFKEALQYIKEHPKYPKQSKEHCAKYDAEWNKQLHEFLTWLK